MQTDNDGRIPVIPLAEEKFYNKLTEIPLQVHCQVLRSWVYCQELGGVVWHSFVPLTPYQPVPPSAEETTRWVFVKTFEHLPFAVMYPTIGRCQHFVI